MRALAIVNLLNLVAAQSLRAGPSTVISSSASATDILEPLPDTTLEGIPPTSPTPIPPSQEVSPPANITTPPIGPSEPPSIPSTGPTNISEPIITPTPAPSIISSRVNASMSTSSIAPNVTTTPAFKYDDSDAPTWVLQPPDLLLDDVNLDLGEASLVADEQVLTLAYTANLNGSDCQALANEYANNASPLMRRHWANVEYARRKRATYTKRCLAAAYEIPMYVHWLVPPDAKADEWVDWGRFITSMDMAKSKLAYLGASVLFSGARVWTGTTAGRITMGELTRADKDFRGFIKATKKSLNALESRNLHTLSSSVDVYIVQEMGGSTIDGVKYTTIGRANFPGVSKDFDADSVHIARMSLPKLGDKEKTNNIDTMWATLPHEIGHWLGLIHLHDSGPGSASEDGCEGPGDYINNGDTRQWKNGDAYNSNVDCDGKQGVERNIMSQYSDGVTYSKGVFVKKQRVRAIVNWLLRRDGLSSKAKVARYYTAKECDTASKKLRRSPEHLLPLVFGPHKRELTKRQVASELSRFCQNTDLTVENYDFSDWAEQGIWNSDSKPLPAQPADTLPNVDTGPSQTINANIGESNFQRVRQEIQQRVDSGQGVDKEYVEPSVVTVIEASPVVTETARSKGGADARMTLNMGWMGVSVGAVLAGFGGLAVL